MTDMDKEAVKQQAFGWANAAVRRAGLKLLDNVWFAVFAGVLLFISEPLRDTATAILNSPEQMNELSEQMTLIEDNLSRKIDNNSELVYGLQADVRIMQRPDKIFDVSAFNTRPLDGYCVTDQECRVRVRLRRLPEAVDCEFVRGSVQWGFINPRSDIFVGAERVDTPAGRTVGLQWESTDINIITPRGLEPTADFVFQASYVNCPGTIEGDAPITRTSNPISFRILNVPPTGDAQ